MIRLSAKPGAWCLPVLFFLCFQGHAQILNIEKARLDDISSEKPYHIKVEADVDFYNRSATNAEKAKFFSSDLTLNATYVSEKHAYLLIGELAYVENNSNSILNNGNLHFRTTFFRENRFSTEVYTQGQFDKFRGLTDRGLVGAAERWRITTGEKFDWHLATGPMFEYERWRSPDAEGFRHKRMLKLSTYTTVRWKISEYIDFNTVVYYQVGRDRDDDVTRHRISNNTNLNFKINEKLSFKTGVSLAYEDKPIVPITDFIYSVENGISLNF